MADDTSKQDATDRSRVAAGEGYEVADFAKKHGMSQAAVRDLIGRIGNDRAKLDAAATAEGKVKRSARRAAKTTGDAATSTISRKPSTPTRTNPKKAAGKSRTVAARPAAAVDPARKHIADTAQAVMATARRSSASVRKRVADAPAAMGKSAGKALDATRSAATSRTAVVLGVAAGGLIAGLAVNLGRKAVVQAPSVMAGDWLEALKVEHKLALTIFDGLQATTDEQPAKRMMLLIQLKHALGKHAFTEENVIYPALRDWGDKADADKLNHDHGYVKQYLYDLEGLDNRSPSFLEKVAAFRADLQAHIAEEEEAIFPPLHASLGEAKNAAVTALANKEGFKLA